MNEKEEKPSAVCIDKIALYNQKMNKVFGEVLKMDWEADKGYQLKGAQLRYVSIAKMKRNLGVCLQRNGINFSVSFVEPQIIANMLCIKAIVTFIDADTGYSDSCTALGCAGAGDKAMQIASSYALKACLSNKFLIIDGIEPEEEENSDRPRGTFTKKTVEEVNEIKSKIAENAVKDEPVITDDALKADTKNVSDDLGYVPTTLEVKTMDAIVKKFDEKLRAGAITQADYDKMKMEHDCCMVNKQTVLAFIKTYRV